MSARKSWTPGRGPRAGAAATPNAWRLCTGCRHPWFRHCYGPNPGCTQLVPADPPRPRVEGRRPWDLCPCAGFAEPGGD